MLRAFGLSVLCIRPVFAVHDGLTYCARPALASFGYLSPLLTTLRPVLTEHGLCLLHTACYLLFGPHLLSSVGAHCGRPRVASTKRLPRVAPGQAPRWRRPASADWPGWVLLAGQYGPCVPRVGRARGRLELARNPSGRGRAVRWRARRDPPAEPCGRLVRRAKLPRR